MSKEQLHEIGQRRHEPAPGDVQALLWEIARLRAIAARADQYLIGPNSLIRDVLRRELDECACVQEQQRMREELFKKG
ncbi:hypothetical protein [Pseudoduganella albidiflava]|uniref:Uncharacterized protein n=1 Tax=Pseudoduganella albidiflava TaxID=321983 RepID=A0ABX5RYZ7_9BURK|nr:hypothetical protein [Pseudoduganella albidiflava]QBI03279.1 hypothetical protein EYF70_22460 [Pseudoduganella albidiflava]